ncbi:MAG: hypothetical protein AB2814_10875, partial [Candidatus Sedimenticola endophacoides]
MRVNPGIEKLRVTIHHTKSKKVLDRFFAKTFQSFNFNKDAYDRLEYFEQWTKAQLAKSGLMHA